MNRAKIPSAILQVLPALLLVPPMLPLVLPGPVVAQVQIQAPVQPLLPPTAPGAPATPSVAGETGSPATGAPASVAAAADIKLETPTVNDPALRMDLFAGDPLVHTPIGMTFTAEGRLLVIESNTHFRPKDYAGPVHDRILWLEDTNKDGKADKANVFFEDTDMTMDIATAPDGAIYVATRNEILRLRDENNDGTPDKVERRLVFLETQGNYP
ncbi:MAG: PVC-type heme-binding CxxCH protein, partial [Verrucomicrobium sp.]